MLYWNTGAREMKNNTLGTPDEVSTNVQSDRCGDEAIQGRECLPLRKQHLGP